MNLVVAPNRLLTHPALISAAVNISRAMDGASEGVAQWHAGLD